MEIFVERYDSLPSGASSSSGDKESVYGTWSTITFVDQVVFRVLESLLLNLVLRNYFDVPSIFSLRRVCRLTRRLIDSDQVWESLIRTWGIPPSPWATNFHPCLSKLARFRDLAYIERHVFLKPSVVSRYNQNYGCEIRRMGFRRDCLFLEFCVRGDMSLGPLQQPTCSRLDYVLHGNVVSRKRPDRMLLLASEGTRHEGFMFFDIDFDRLFECELYFQYGSGGYSVELLCMLNRTFCKRNKLNHFVPVWRWYFPS